MKRILLLIILTALLVGCEAADPITDDLFINRIYGTRAVFDNLRLTGQSQTEPAILINPGPLVSTTQSGAIEYNGRGYYLTPCTTRRAISQASNSIIVPASVTNSVAETTVFTIDICANELRTHLVYVVRFYGEYSTASAADLITLKIKVAGNTIVELTGPGAKVTDAPVHGDFVVTTRSIGATGTMSAHGNIMLGTKDVHANTSSMVIDTTADTTITITAQWDGANPGNILTIDQAFLEVLN